MQEKKIVLYIITKGNFGGAQKYVYDLATHLPKDQFEAIVACGEGEVLKAKLIEKGVRVIDLKSSQRDINYKKDIKTFFEIKNIIREIKPDVVHLNSSKIGILGGLASFLNKTPKTIFTAHNWAFNYESTNFLSYIFYYISHYITTLICDVTIAVSFKIKLDMDWLPFIKEKIKVVYNGIETFNTLKKSDSREILAPNTEKTVILSIAELHNNKGIDLALRGIALLPEQIKNKIIYVVVGEGEEKENLHELTAKLELLNIVKFLGLIPNAKQLLSGADIFLLSSRTEAFPYVILEAGLAGIPTISTSVGGIPELIKDMKNGILIHPKNPKEIAEAIIYMTEHKTKRLEFGREIKNTVSTFFSFEKMLKETLNLYELT